MHRFWKAASSFLIVLGLLISLASFASAIAEAQIPAAPSDPLGIVVPSSNNGFYPLSPRTENHYTQTAPTLPPLSSDPQKNSPVKTSVPPISQITASPKAAAQDPVIEPIALPTVTQMPVWIPDRIMIPAIELDAPVIWAKQITITYQNDNFVQWVAPNSFAAGELASSAPLGRIGNTVLIGHHNIYGEVFMHLVELEAGDTIFVYSGEQQFKYTIALKMILKERFEPVEVRLKNAEWIASSLDERLTLVTCWPYKSNTHRLIIVAVPDRPNLFDPDSIK